MILVWDAACGSPLASLSIRDSWVSLVTGRLWWSQASLPASTLMRHLAMWNSAAYCWRMNPAADCSPVNVLKEDDQCNWYHKCSLNCQLEIPTSCCRWAVRKWQSVLGLLFASPICINLVVFKTIRVCVWTELVIVNYFSDSLLCWTVDSSEWNNS